MNDYLRESMSYFGLYLKMFQAKRICTPLRIRFGNDPDQYCLFYEPKVPVSDKVIFWIHGGGWNAGNPDFFDFVGQCAAAQGYRLVSIGYRLSPRHKYPCQLRDVCAGYNAARRFLQRGGISAEKIVLAGPSAGAHLASILCYCTKAQEIYHVDISPIIGFIGTGGPYCFDEHHTLTLSLLLRQLFRKGYNRRNGEPLALMHRNHIPMLLIQSRHDGLIPYTCAERFSQRAKAIGNRCELYPVTDRKNTHSWYTTGMFLETRETNQGLDKFFSWIEAL